MPTLHITRGLPGSGKSTYARAWIAENPTGRFRVNRDSLRAMGHDSTHIKPSNTSAGTERAIIAARNALVVTLLRHGIDVIVDDTNLPERAVDELRRLADRAAATIEVVDFRHVPVEVCIERDSLREGRERVGEQVIRDMYGAHLAKAAA